jgi:hypothetical protein
MKLRKTNVNIEEGMQRLANFIKNYHGSQDWEHTISDIQDYIAVFIGAKGKEIYGDLMERTKGGCLERRRES